MPNNCKNDLYIASYEKPELVAEVLRTIGADQTPPRFDCDAIIPRPPHLRGWPDYVCHGPVLTWCIEHWGTKWGAYDVERRDRGGMVCVSFSSAWNAPEPVIAAMARRWPDVVFSLEWFEGGAGLCGGSKYNDQGPGSVETWGGPYRGILGF